MLRRAAVQLAHSLQEASALQSARAGPVPAVMHSWLCPTQARQGSSTAPSGAEADPFTAQMQRRTEEELRALLEERTQGDEHDAGEADEAEEEVRCFCVCTLLFCDTVFAPPGYTAGWCLVHTCTATLLCPLSR